VHRGRRSIGLSLSELLLAVLILVVLSSLLVSALTQSAAHARQAVCLANIRSICQGIRMYLADTDGLLPPSEHNAEALAYFNTRPGGADENQWDPERFPNCYASRQSNPYLRWPVILDDYLPTRDVWRCPDARLEGGASFINGGRDWLAHLKAHEGEWGFWGLPYICPARTLSFPAGWGGEVTDTLTQHRMAVPRSERGLRASPGMFLWSVATNEVETESGAYKVEDPAWYVVVADGGATLEGFNTGTLAYPDLCHLECASDVGMDPSQWQADWERCPWTRQCGAIAEMKRRPELRRPYARHFGGVNLGFLDGHARWFDSEEVIALSPSGGDPQRGRLRGYVPWGPTVDAHYDPAILPLY